MEAKLDKQLYEETGNYAVDLGGKIKQNEKTAKKVADWKQMEAFIKDYRAKVKEFYNELNNPEATSNPMNVLALLKVYDSIRGELKAQEKTFMGYRSFWQKLSGSRGEYGKLEDMLKNADKALTGYMAENMKSFRSYFSAIGKEANAYADKYMGAHEAHLAKELANAQKAIAAQKKK